jgi:hypothetical protein
VQAQDAIPKSNVDQAAAAPIKSERWTPSQEWAERRSPAYRKAMIFDLQRAKGRPSTFLRRLALLFTVDSREYRRKKTLSPTHSERLDCGGLNSGMSA